MLDFQRAIRNEQSILFILAAALGVAVGYGVIGFRYLIGLFQFLFFGSDSEAYFATVVEILPMWHVVLAPPLGGLVIGLFVHYVMPERRNQGWRLSDVPAIADKALSTQRTRLAAFTAVEFELIRRCMVQDQHVHCRL